MAHLVLQEAMHLLTMADAGEELIFSYGSHGNEKLFVHYGFMLSYKKETCLASPRPAGHHPKATAAAVRPPAGHLGGSGQGVVADKVRSPILHTPSRSSNTLFVSSSFVMQSESRQS